MYIGITLWNLRAANAAEKIRKAVELGFDSVSFWGPAFDDPAHPDRLTSVIEQAAVRLIRQHRLRLTFHIGFLEHEDCRTKLAAVLAKIGEFLARNALEEQTPAICFDPAYRKPEQGHDLVFDFEGTVALLKLALEKTRNVRIGIENWIFTSRVADFARIATAVNDARLAALLDLAHLHIALQQGLSDRRNPREFLRDLPLEVIELHVHDNDGVLDKHWLPGKGTLDLGEYAGAVRESQKLAAGAVLDLESTPDFKGLNLDQPEDVREIARCRELIARSFFNGA